MRILQVLAFGKHISRDQHAQFLSCFDLLALAVRFRRKMPGQRCWIGALPSGFLHLFDTARDQMRLEIASGVGKLGEDKQFFLRVALIDQFYECSQLGICISLPVTAQAQDLQQGLRIREQVFGKCFLEQRSRQPLEAAFQCAAVRFISLGSTGAVVGLGAQAIGGGWVGNVFVATIITIVVSQQAIGVLVVMACVEQFSALRAQRNIQAVLHGMQNNEVAQDMALDGQNEGRAGAFQALEKVGAAKTHQAGAGTGKPFDRFCLVRRRRRFWLGGDVVAKTIARQDQFIDRVNHRVAVEACVRVGRIGVVDLEVQTPGQALREIGFAAIRE